VLLIRFERGESSSRGSLLARGPGCQKVGWGMRLSGPRDARCAWAGEAVGMRTGEAVGTLAGSKFAASAAM
jgi:hypothetical protein